MTDLLFIFGAAAVIAGCALVSASLGLVVGGLLAIAYSVGLARGEA